MVEYNLKKIFEIKERTTKFLLYLIGYWIIAVPLVIIILLILKGTIIFSIPFLFLIIVWLILDILFMRYYYFYAIPTILEEIKEKSKIKNVSKITGWLEILVDILSIIFFTFIYIFMYLMSSENVFVLESITSIIFPKIFWIFILFFAILGITGIIFEIIVHYKLTEITDQVLFLLAPLLKLFGINIDYILLFFAWKHLDIEALIKKYEQNSHNEKI